MTRGTEFHWEDHFVNFTSSLLSPLSGSLLFVMPFCAKAIIRLARRLVTLWSGRTHTATKTSTDPREAHTRPTSCRSSLRLGHAFLVVSSGTCKHHALSNGKTSAQVCGVAYDPGFLLTSCRRLILSRARSEGTLPQ